MDFSWAFGRAAFWILRDLGSHFYYRKRHDHLLAVASRFVCKAQGDFAAYSFYCGDSHRRMKNCLRDCEARPSDGDALIRLRREIEGAEGYIGFESYVNRGLANATRETFERMEEFFSLRVKERKAFAPRFCVKVFSPKGEGIFVLSRSTKNARPEETLPWEYIREEDTGLSSVAETGRPYLENDIPESFRRGNYKNPRIDQQNVKAYQKPWLQDVRPMFSENPFEDVEWKRCWKRNGQGENLPPTINCYKSTLVVPVSLSGNGMSDEFRVRFTRSSFDYGNLLLGFLCVDSHSANFFEEGDKKIGYIFADVLSLFLILNMSLLEHSRAYQKAKICLGNRTGFGSEGCSSKFFRACGG
jgi:hypothetical protein